jgi:hypothetical protein
MKLFWIPFIIIFTSGSVALYHYAPMCSATVVPLVPNWMKPQDPTLASTTLITNRVVGTIIPKDPAHKPPPKKKQVLPEDESFVSPALEGVFYARASEHPGWGITYQKTTYYNSKGAYQGLIAGGTLLNCLKEKLTSSKGELLECQPDSAIKTNSPIFIARKDAHFFTGDYNKLVVKQLEMLKDYYLLNGKISDRRKKLMEDGATLNPHFLASRAAYVALTENIEEASALQKKLATATDSKKMALDEALRALKIKETKLKATFEEEQKKFVEWKKAHANEIPNPDMDSMIKTWDAEKKKMIAALPGLAF